MYPLDHKGKNAFINALMQPAQNLMMKRVHAKMTEFGFQRIIVNGLQCRMPNSNADFFDEMTLEQLEVFRKLQATQEDYKKRATAVWQALLPVLMLPGLDNNAAIPELLRKPLNILTTEPFADRMALAPEPVRKQWADKFEPEYEFLVGLHSIVI